MRAIQMVFNNVELRISLKINFLSAKMYTTKSTCYKRLSEDAAQLYADGVMHKSVLRIRNRDPGSGALLTPGSGIRCLFYPRIRDPRRVKSHHPDPG
jgi:hypothetical protein